jgi:hypothetical protein
MATRKPSTKSNVGLPVMIACIAVLILLIVGLAWHFFSPTVTEGAAARPLTAQEQAKKDYAKQMATASGGDFGKLSQEDQRKMLALYGPQAPFILRQEVHKAKNPQ